MPTTAQLHTINRLLNGRLLSEALQRLEECRNCSKFSAGKCSLLDELDFCRRLAYGHCPEWDNPVSKRYADANTDRLKVVLYSPALLCGGAERWLVDLATGLDPTRFYVCVAIEFINLVDKTLIEKLYSKQITVIFGKSHCKEVCDAADILLSWCTFPKCKATYKVYCSHGCDHYTDALVEDYASRSPHDYHFTAVSERSARPWERFENVSIIYNGSDTSRLIPKLPCNRVRLKLRAESDELLIGYIGRIVPEKNPWIVAIAAHELRNRGVKAKAVFVGVNSEKLHYYPDCAYVPKTENIGDYLSAFDVFMLPSNSEAFSLAITEAWLSKIPVVATNVGAIPELERKYGKLVVQIGTSPSNAVLEAVSKENKEVVERAYTVAMANFTTEKMIQRWEKYFELLTGIKD